MAVLTNSIVPSATSLSSGAKAGIGIGAGLGGLAIIVLAWYIIQKRKKVARQKEEKKDGPPLSELSRGEKHLAWELEGRALVHEIG